MDDARFDRLTTSLAAGHSRRTIAKLLGGGLAGGLAALLGGHSITAHHRPGHCARKGQRVTPRRDCCAGLVERANGRCAAAPPPPPPPPECVENGIGCTNDAECCEGLFCNCTSFTCLHFGVLGTGACCKADNECFQDAGLSCEDGVCCNPASPETCELIVP